MRPLILKGHERPLTHLQFNPEGDLLFSCSKARSTCVWFSDNGELAGTYEGHTGAIWACDVSFDSTTLITGSADNTAKIWDVETGTELATVKHTASVRSVGWSIGGNMFFTATESFAKFTPKVGIYEYDAGSDQAARLVSTIECPTGLTGASWGPNDQTIYTCDNSGRIAIYEASNGRLVDTAQIHNASINKFSWNKEKYMFVTASKDGTAKLVDADLKVLKTYQTGRPVNCAAISPLKYHILLGGGESADTVATSKLDSQQFRARFFHTIYETEVGSMLGHFGTMTCIAMSPDGKSFATGAEDSTIRLHHLDNEYLEMHD